jgi:7,8-dihydroneopterin aldolase/epimerase/oxygenase
MAIIALEGMEFHAYHGCFKEEQVTGNTFMVDLWFETDTSAAEASDDLNDTVNYAEIYEIVKKEMEMKSKLLEHIGKRIMKAIQKDFPVIQSLGLKISKLNPPLGGRVNNVSVFLNSPDE